MNPVLRVVFFAQIWNCAQLGEFRRVYLLRCVVLESISDHKHDGTITQRQQLFNKRKPNCCEFSVSTFEVKSLLNSQSSSFGFIQISSPKSAFAQCHDNFLLNFSTNFLCFLKKLTLFVRIFSSPERVVRVRALAGDIVLCSWARHLTLTCLSPPKCINGYR